MSRLEEYIKRYEGLHTGTDPFYQKETLITDNNSMELFSGIQFLRKFPAHIKKISEQKKRAVTLLDYGCGRGHAPWRTHEQYKNGLWGSLPTQIQNIYLYDPAWPPFATKPPQGWKFDVVGCADVMEHIPEEDVDTVLADIASYCSPDGTILFSISGNKAFKSFLDKENLHCTVRPIDWWKDKIESVCKRSYVLIHTDDKRTPSISTIIGTKGKA
jgi:hypothetical protein